jgi:ABC-type sugar transport system substrate-binding protein
MRSSCNPSTARASQGAAQLVNDADIPLFTLNTGFPDDADVDVVSYIGQNEVEAGKMQGEYLNDQLPEGSEIVLIAGTIGASWTDRRADGYTQ